jgi:hypothetical protein
MVDQKQFPENEKKKSGLFAEMQTIGRMVAQPSLLRAGQRPAPLGQGAACKDEPRVRPAGKGAILVIAPTGKPKA